jgi:hypothetical protein
LKLRAVGSHIRNAPFSSILVLHRVGTAQRVPKPKSISSEGLAIFEQRYGYTGKKQKSGVRFTYRPRPSKARLGKPAIVARKSAKSAVQKITSTVRTKSCRPKARS